MSFQRRAGAGSFRYLCDDDPYSRTGDYYRSWSVRSLTWEYVGEFNRNALEEFQGPFVR